MAPPRRILAIQKKPQPVLLWYNMVVDPKSTLHRLLELVMAQAVFLAAGYFKTVF
jgi:hypothetical protein